MMLKITKVSAANGVPHCFASLSGLERPAVVTRASSPRAGPRESAPQNVREDDGVVVLGVVGGVDERQRACARSASECRQPRTVGLKLLDVASAELLKAAWFVPEPLPELGARGQLLLPVVELGSRARDATWPQPVDQHAITVLWFRRLIRALQADIHTSEIDMCSVGTPENPASLGDRWWR